MNTPLLDRGGKETRAILERCGAELLRYLVGYGVDFGCEFDPVPGASVLVDGQSRVHTAFKDTHEVHIRDINNGFDDWIAAGRQFDFVYSSHLLEHVRDPHAFLRTCHAILKPGGHLVLVLPDEDMYWPNGHPNANPDHKWWHLNPRKVTRWVQDAFRTSGETEFHQGKHIRHADRASAMISHVHVTGVPVHPLFISEATGPRGGDWSFVLVFQKPEEE